MRWPWSLPPRDDITERVKRAEQVRSEAKCLVDRIQKVIDMTEGALEEVDDERGLSGGGTTQDQRRPGETGR